MFGCIYQLWDWLEAPPLFTPANMDAKKLQHLQQQQQKKMPLAYQTNFNDYRTATHSPVFQQQQQQQQHQHQPQQNYHMQHLATGYQQSPATTSNTSSGPLTPIDIQPQTNNKCLLKHPTSNTTSSSQHSSPYHQQYSGEQIYQSQPERAYVMATSRLQAASHNAPSTSLQQQYQQLQQAKMKAQLQTQTEAVQQQQRTFAMRQQINPPVPQGHYHMSQSSSLMSAATQQQQSPVSHQRAPPSTLNLSSQFQPAAGPLKVSSKQKPSGQHQMQQQHYQQQEHSIYAQQQQQLQLQLQLQHQQLLQHQQQQQQRLKADLQTPGGSEHSPVYIQQNHPGHVVNQACQTQISAVKTTSCASSGGVSKTPSSEDSAGKSPAHAPLDRKKSAGSIQALKSPMTKRPTSSTVSISGWLYKQGSDGLKVWRKRWFVLAEYCLYYYKGPEEEKLLGSILLPSYRVSACLPEDKIYRKYAFKCEHQNMRTYWLAAETGESMVQWVRALTAATMMQAPSSGESDQNSQPSVGSSVNHSGENSDSGIHTLQSQQSKMSLNQGPVTPASDNANVQSASSSNSGGAGGGAQPLYANAPPKPRRITDGGYSSPSPEHSVDNEAPKQNQLQLQHQQQSTRRAGIMSPNLQQQQQYQQQQMRSQQHHAIYDTRTGNVTSTLRLQQQQQHQIDNLDSQFQQQLQLTVDDYNKSPPPTSAQQYIDMEEQIMRLQQQRAAVPEELYGERELHMQKLIQQRYAGLYPNAERRTPDAYGRSKSRLFSDYEDIYNLNQSPAVMHEAVAASYRRPLSPPSYESNKHVPPMPSRYTPNHVESNSGAAPSLSSSSNIRSRSATAAIVRPHSADFLEYDVRSDAITAQTPAGADADAALATQSLTPDTLRTQRPKSSLDINRTPDSIYYSEASYAEKMRKSALYLQNPQAQTGAGGGSGGAQPQHPSSAYRPGASDIYSSGGVSGMNTIGYENPYERVYKRSELLGENQGAASMPRMSRSLGGAPQPAAIRSASMHPHHHQLATQQNELEGGDVQQRQQQYYQSSSSAASTQQQYLQQQNDQFLRSASARLPKRGAFDDEYVVGGRTTTSPAPKTGAASSALSRQEGERKREESMKRLLEWKQRMLQSPLTRKGIQQTVAGGPGSNMTAMSKLGSNPNILLASTAVASGAHRANRVGLSGGNTVVGGVSGIQRSRSETHANGGTGSSAAGYNSYSSDDEDPQIAPDGVREVKSPAGRSTATTASTRQSSNKKAAATVTATTSSCSSNPNNSSSYTKATTIAIVDTHCNKETTQQNDDNDNENDNDDDDDDQNTTNRNNNENICTHVNTIATWPTTTLSTTPIKPEAATTTNPIKIQKLTPILLTKTKQIVVKPILKVLADEENLEQPLKSPSSMTATGKLAVTGRNGGNYDSETNRVACGRISGPILGSRTDLHLNISDIKRQTEPPLPPAEDDLSKFVCSESVRGFAKKPKELAPESPQITNYIPVYTTKILTTTESSRAIKDYENIVLQKEKKVLLDTVERNLSGMEEGFVAKTTFKRLDVETKEATQALQEEDRKEFSENRSILKDIIVELKPPTKSRTETFAINREETPILMNLQAFKAAQEAKQHIKETCGISFDKSTETEGTEREELFVTARESLIPEYDDDTDTACEEYTDDDLDEALAVEEEGEEKTAQPGNQEGGDTSIPLIPKKPHLKIKAVVKDIAETFQIYENKETMAMISEPQTPHEREHLHNESHYLPMTPKKLENTPTSPLTMVSFNDSNAEEENPYVEMTKTLHDDESKSNYETVCVAETSIFLQNKAKQLEVQMEPVYMELGQVKQQHATNMASSFDANNIPEMDRSLGRSTLKKQSVKQKSDTLKKKSKKSSNERLQSKRKDLPDILKPSQSSLALSSDSSDADDESSKHIDGKKMRSRTRFSLSDTFRPASYYLGATSTLANCAESSDSEIVSPPPIPSSPPPTEDLKTEEIFSSENYDTVKRRDSSNSGSKCNLSYEQLPKVHTSNTSLNISKQSSEIALKCSRLSLPDQISKLRGSGNFKIPSPSLLNNHERTLSDSNYSFQTDNSSNTSSDFDLYNKLKQNSPSFIASPLPCQSNSSLSQKLPSIITQIPSFIAGGGDSSETDSVEFRQRQGSDSELDRQRSRRPLSEESIIEIESMNERFEETLRSTDLDMYLNQLQTSDLYLYQNTTSLDAGAAGAGSLTNLIKPPEIFRNKDDDEHFYGNIHFVSSTDSLQKLGHDWKEERERRNALLREANLVAQSETDGASSTTRPTPLHSRNNSNISEHSAPYYYSELTTTSRDVMMDIPPLTTLNNQRDVHAQSASNIEHINNPIKQHASINPATMDMLTEKDQAIDSKNLYKMKTNIEKLSYSSGKNLKSGDPFSQATTSPQSFHLQQLQCPQMKLKNDETNLYQEWQPQTQPLILNPLNESPDLTAQTELHVAKQSNLPMRKYVRGEGLESVAVSSEGIFGEDNSIDRDPLEPAHPGIEEVDDIPLSLSNTKLQLSNLSSSNTSKLSVQSSMGSGELLWEEDTLWRESLRRVSERHARSLDDLDRISASPMMNVKLVDLVSQTKSRLSREVTYVNDNISPHLRDHRFRPRLSDPQTREEMTENTEYHRVLSTETLMNEHDVYVQLSETQQQREAASEVSSDVYEVLREDSLCSGFSQKSNTGDMDRETLRQWDSMSSGLMKNATGLMAGGIEYKQEASSTANLSSVRSIIQQLNASCDPLDANASISVRNVRNLPKSNLTVKPDPGDPYPQQTLENFDQMNKLTSSYYGSVPDTRYAKTTNLATEKIGGGDSAYFGSNGVMLASSTPVHAGNSLGVDYYRTNGGVNAGGLEGSGGGEVGVGSTAGLNGSLYDVHQSGYRTQAYPIRRVGSRAEIDLLERETSTQMRNLDVSAGDLLSRTHEELVLLLIQLRRQNSNTARAIEQCCTDIHEVQNRLLTVDGLTRAESIQRLDYLKQHLLDLERQYEKSKPLVNLVDNMVKLGSLYRTNEVTGQRQTQQQHQQNQQHQRSEVVPLDRLEFNQRIQEQRMLQEEQKQWDRLSPDQSELQSKVQQLYYLDQLLQEESGTLQNLQRDKEDLERALGGIRARIQDTSGQPLALEAARKQQHMLERELSRVHQLLAENSKKLEQTVAGNSRLEQELLVLRQKLQASRTTRDSQGLFVSDTYTNNTTAMLESELKRVQTLVGDMQRQRQELSAAVRQLTENSTRLYQEIGNKQNSSTGGNSGSSCSGHIKKRSNSMCWIETDLDSMLSTDRTLSDSALNLSTPLYVDTSPAVHGTSGSNLMNSACSSKYSDYNTGGESLHTEPPDSGRRDRTQYRYNDSSDNLETSGVDSDGFLETNPFAALSNQEKQEIKTVRIVKRESERRQRDRDRVGLSSSTQNLDQVLEEEQQLALLQSGSSSVYPVVNGYGEPDYQTNGSDGGRSKSLPRQSYTETPKSRHHRHHHHQSSYSGQHNSRRYETNNTNLVSQQSKYPDYYKNGADKNSNYSVAGRHRGLTNGSITPKEHLNPLASAYFAKQHSSHSSHSRNASQAALRQKTDSLLSLKSLTDLSPGPVFQSEAARQIINELSAGSASEDAEKVVEKVPAQHKHRRAVPREKRRHYTAPNNVNVKAMENIQAENDMNRNNTNWRARDDLDMEVALRPRMNAPDVVRSALGHGEKISENTIDNLLLAPNKILIPERYIPEKAPELSPEEKKRRQEKVESIKKMLAETPISTANDTVSLPPSKINAEKKQREHLLQLNQILAQQVMQMSKIVAEKAMSKVNKMKNLPKNATREGEDEGVDEEDRSESPAASLPIFQQRENFFT